MAELLAVHLGAYCDDCRSDVILRFGRTGAVDFDRLVGVGNALVPLQLVGSWLCATRASPQGRCFGTARNGDWPDMVSAV